MYDIVLSSKELRSILKGQTTYRKCPDCQGEGEVWFIEYALKARPHDNLQRLCSAQEASDFVIDDWPDYAYGIVGHEPCDTCDGVGYVRSIDE